MKVVGKDATAAEVQEIATSVVVVAAADAAAEEHTHVLAPQVKIPSPRHIAAVALVPAAAVATCPVEMALHILAGHSLR